MKIILQMMVKKFEEHALLVLLHILIGFGKSIINGSLSTSSFW